MARGFIDILDAQSEIKPSGFQNRVKAAGVRDYGEDVADRNIGENGVDLASAKVQAFYATNGGSPHDRQDGAPAPSVSMAQFGDKDQPFKPPRRHDSLDMGGRTKSLTSASVGQIPFRTTIFNPDRSQRHETIMEDVPESARSRRRQSLGSYSLGSFIPTTPSNGPLDVHKIADSSVSPSTRRQKRRSTTGGEAPLNELGIFSTRPTESPSSPKTSQKAVYVVKHNYSLPVQQRPKTSGHAQPETYQAVRPPSRGGGTADHTSFCTALESALPSPVDAATPGAGFNIDDYLSSDDDVDADSFITTRHRDSGLGATQEEELLFSDSGYGEAGLQLPGLFDSLSAVPEPNYVSPSRPSMRQSHSFGSPVRFQRRLSLDPRVEAPIFSLDEEDDGPGDYDILPARADLALGRRGTRRISAIGTVYQSIEEEREEKVDVRTAIRLRKEAKAKQRAMARLSRVQRRKAVDDDADHADVE
ncbi:hypothetical protein COL154_009251 [Colletotrichum chrysophilum]|nr:hypothetical protein KNSL1_008189 [Colletotrichum chrysophilum]KAJ0358343.1 hypothetical protein COL154_009251 [Colletotrichum chrysophilum]